MDCWTSELEMVSEMTIFRGHVLNRLQVENLAGIFVR